MRIVRLNTYTPEVANRIRELLTQLSRSGKDKGKIPEEWFHDIIKSPWHELILAVDNDRDMFDASKIIGIISVSIVMGPGILKNAYIEDFVVDSNSRCGGVGTALWNAMIDFAREKGCKRIEFTCGNGRDVAQAFYKKHGATVYDTNFFRVEL